MAALIIILGINPMAISSTIAETTCIEERHIALEQDVEQVIENSMRSSLNECLNQIEETMVMTSQIEILDLQYEEGVLSIDLSDNVLEYGGGNQAEYQLVQSLLRWGFENTDADHISLLVGGRYDRLPEGTQVICYPRERYLKYYTKE